MTNKKMPARAEAQTADTNLQQQYNPKGGESQMRTKEEICNEIAKVKTAKRNAERKNRRCISRLEELEAELKEAEQNENQI